MKQYFPSYYLSQIVILPSFAGKMLYPNIMKNSRIILPQLFSQTIRTMSVKSKFLQIEELGEPHKVLKMCETQIDSPKDNEVLVKIIATPINPASINIIQGKYGESPKLPFIPGNEAIAEVLECGSSVQDIQVGDRVIPIGGLVGTWRTHAIYPNHDLLKVPSNVDNANAATITVNPATAFRMLRDFVKLNAGDTVIQNGGNSAVGQAVIQLCKVWGLNSVNVIRDRPNVAELKETLKSLGATEVLTEEEIRTTTLFKSKKLPAPKLGFNCIGGKSATNVVRHLSSKGVLVTYGAMSREPLTIPNSALIFKDIAFRGFWVSKWSKENSLDERKKMYNELFELMGSGRFQPPIHRLVSLDQYKEAMIQLTDVKGMVGEKILFDCTQ